MRTSRRPAEKHPELQAQSWFGFAAILLTLTVVFLPAAVFSSHSARAQDSFAERGPSRSKLTPEQQQEIVEKNVRIRKLQEGIIDHKIKILDTRQKERTLLGELEKIENELRTQKKLLADLKIKSEKQEVLIASKQEHLSRVLAKKKAHQLHVKNRLAAYYRLGAVGVMNVLFSSKSLPELLDFKEYFSIMVERDHVIIQEYLGQIRESNRAREEHAREKLRLLKLADELAEKEKKLSRIREEKNILLKQVNTEQGLYNQAVAEIEEAVADLAVTLQKIQPATDRTAAALQPERVGTEKKKLPRAEIASDGFTGQKGLLEPPVHGTIITRFGQKIKGKFDSFTVSNGIDIEVEKGMDITAVYGGKVIHSGYLRGYGNLMIIDHGQQYFSLTARAAEYFQPEGTKVIQGEIIGVTGEADPLYGKGIHFEIRKGSNPEDPLLWLKKGSLPNAASIPAE